MLPLTYDEIELILILICGPIRYFVGHLPQDISVEAFNLIAAIVGPLQTFITWSVWLRPSPFLRFADLYLSLWD